MKEIWGLDRNFPELKKKKTFRSFQGIECNDGIFGMSCKLTCNSVECGNDPVIVYVFPVPVCP